MNHQRLLDLARVREQRHKRRENKKLIMIRKSRVDNQRIWTELGDLTVQASKSDQVWMLRPFAQQISVVDYREALSKGKDADPDENFETKLNNVFKVIDSDVRPKKKKKEARRERSIIQIKTSLSSIINPEATPSASFIKRRRQLFKSMQQHVIDEHIHEINKATSQAKALKSRLSVRMTEKYPQRFMTEPQEPVIEFTTFKNNRATTANMDTRRTFTTNKPRDTNSRNQARKWSYFYSRSKKRCFMQKYIPEPRPEEIQQNKTSFSFFEYLSDRQLGRRIVKSNEGKRCVNLLKGKDKILEIEKEGSQKQLFLKQCLDKIIIENLLR